jgi:FAD synthetase
MRKVLVFGTFDLFHKGHEYFLCKARLQGDKLIVVVARDRNVEKFKKRKPVEPELERLKCIKSLPYVDQAILGTPDHSYMKIINKIKPNIICLGYDQNSFDLVDKLKGSDIIIMRLEPYREEVFKSSILRQELKEK